MSIRIYQYGAHRRPHLAYLSFLYSTRLPCSNHSRTNLSFEERDIDVRDNSTPTSSWECLIMFQSCIKPARIQRQDTTKRVEIRRERDEELDGLASLAYHERMTEFARNSTRHWVKNSHTVLDFRPLYAITLHNLQRQLAREIHLLNERDVTDTQLEKIRELLKQYTSALRDFEFIHSNRWSTNFVKDIAASRIDNGPGSRLQTAVISEFNLALSGPQYTLYSDDDLLGSFDPSLMAHSVTPGRLTRATQRQQSEIADKRKAALKKAWQRFASAMLGGLALVTPVLIIVVGTTNVPLRALIVVSVSIFLFALAVAILSDASSESLLAATAAYAAVLVVFISNSGPCPQVTVNEF